MNMFNQNQLGGQGMMFNNGNYYTNLNPQYSQMNSMLSADEVSTLKSKNATQFNIGCTNQQKMQAMCNHHYPENGNFSLKDNGDGTVTCVICGETFTPLTDISKEEAADICADYNDLVNTAKTFFVGMPKEAGRNLYQTFSFIKKMPEFFDIAKDCYNKMDSVQVNTLRANGNTNSYTMLNMLMNPNTFGMQNQMPGTQYAQVQPNGVMPQQMNTMGAMNQAQFANPTMMGGMNQGMPQMPQMPNVTGMQTATNVAVPNSNRPIGVVEPQVDNTTLSATATIGGPAPLEPAKAFKG